MRVHLPAVILGAQAVRDIDRYVTKQPNGEQTMDQWAIVELMGHVKLAGKLSEEERFGTKMGRIDIPSPGGSFVTQYFGGASVYRVTPCEEKIARGVALQYQVPVPYELKLIEQHDDEEESEYPDHYDIADDYQKDCTHPGEHVTADILEGDSPTIEVQWCRLCGAVRQRHGKEPILTEWRVPCAVPDNG